MRRSLLSLFGVIEILVAVVLLTLAFQMPTSMEVADGFAFRASEFHVLTNQVRAITGTIEGHAIPGHAHSFAVVSRSASRIGLVDLADEVRCVCGGGAVTGSDGHATSGVFRQDAMSPTLHDGCIPGILIRQV